MPGCTQLLLTCWHFTQQLHSPAQATDGMYSLGIGQQGIVSQQTSRGCPTMTEQALTTVSAVIPALNEEGSIGPIVERLLAAGLGEVIVADNGGTDATAAIATAAGAVVVPAERRGYGSACLAGIAAVRPEATAIVFCDADGADDLDKLQQICGPIVADQADLIVGSRTQGKVSAGALTGPQRMGNAVSTILMRLLFWRRVSDLGPFRCISRQALETIAMNDPAFGWTAEMQTKIFRGGFRYQEVAVDALVRVAGESKISGRWWPSCLAGWAIMKTIFRYGVFQRAPKKQAAT